MKQKICLSLIFTLLISFISHDMLLARAFQSQSYSLAVIPFAVRGRIPGDASERVAERMQVELTRTNMFVVTNMATVKSTLRDNGIVPSNCGSIECGRQAGRILGARLVANGEMRRVGSRIILEARIVHVASGKIVQSVNEQYFDGNVNSVIQDMPNIIEKLVGKQVGSTPPPQAPATEAPESRQQEPDLLGQENQEPSTPAQDPDDVFTIGDPEGAPTGQPAMRRSGGGGGMKWALIGLLVAGGVGAGVLLSNKSKSDDNNGNGDGSTVTKLPGHPIFP